MPGATTTGLPWCEGTVPGWVYTDTTGEFATTQLDDTQRPSLAYGGELARRPRPSCSFA